MRYVVKIQTLALSTVTELLVSDIYCDAVIWMQNELINQIVDVPDGEYFAILCSEQGESLLVSNIKITNKNIVLRS